MGRLRCVVGVLAAAVLALPFAAGQGLGDAAKKEKSRVAQGQKSGAPKKSFTDEDLKSGAPSSWSAGETAPSETSSPQPPLRSTSAEGTTVPEEESRARDEEMWRRRVADAKARIETARKKHEAIAAVTLVPGYEIVDEKGVPVIRTVEELQALTAKAKAELDATERALEDLLEQARRAGVPPGWLR